MFTLKKGRIKKDLLKIFEIKNLFTIGILILLLSVFKAQADELTYHGHSVEPLEITVYAYRTASDLRAKTYSSSVVDADNIDDIEVAGVDLQTTGPKGQQTSLFIRGTNSNHSLIAINGISIKDHSTISGNDDLGQIGILGFDQIEIIKGPAGSIYGPDAIGGVINLQSGINFDNEIKYTLGSNNLKKQNLSLSKNVNFHVFSLDVEREASDSISVAEGTENDPYVFRNYNFAYETYLNDGYVLSSSLIGRNNDSSLDGGGVDDLDYTGNWQFNNKQVALKNKTTVFVFNNAQHKRTYTDNNLVSTYNSNSNTFLTHKTTTVNEIDFTYGLEHVTSDADFLINLPYYTSLVDASRKNTGVFFGSDYEIDGTVATFGIRYDNADSFNNELTYRFGVARNKYRLSYSTGFKTPTVYEMYGLDNYGFEGNPNLFSETSKSYEIGYNDGALDVALFTTSVTDTLTYEGSTYTNNGTSRHNGAEIQYTNTFGPITLVNGYTLLFTEDTNGQNLLRRPKHTYNGNVYYDIGSTTRLKLNARYDGKYDDIHSSTYQRTEMSSVSLLNVSYQTYINNFLFELKVDNVTNKRYNKPHGYKQTGRTYLASVAYKF
jgi:vitamin B12 transporter